MHETTYKFILLLKILIQKIPASWIAITTDKSLQILQF